jgi:hypothetical protein
MLKQNSLILILPVFLLGCGGGKITLAPEASVMKEEGVLSMNVEWVKDKKKKYDIRMRIRNEAKTPIITRLGDMACFRGERQGMLKHTFFNTGERTIDFHIGEQKVFQMVCDLGMKVEGPFRIVFGRVYDNPSDDGATVGKEIATNVEWKASMTD